MRLDKFLAHTTEMTRQQAQHAIRAGKVSVNGCAVYQAAKQLLSVDVVNFDGVLLQKIEPRYFMLHKPAGYVCANSDGHHPVVLDLIHEPRRETLQIAGRLDADTTGLVLLTDDGQWNHRITAPASHCIKRYRVVLDKPVTDSEAEQLQMGVQLDGEKKITKPSQLFFVDHERRCVKLMISEGKYHQVKRMFAAVGNRVVGLHRESIGNIELDIALAEGQYRLLTRSEVVGV